MPEVIVNISPAGRIEIDAQGYEGAACDTATEQLEIVLGGGLVKKEPKPERFAAPSTTVDVKQTF